MGKTKGKTYQDEQNLGQDFAKIAYPGRKMSRGHGQLFLGGMVVLSLLCLFREKTFPFQGCR